MKTNSIKYFLLGFLLVLSVSIFAQGTPPPPPGQGHGTGNDAPMGGGAPIGSGMAILISLGALYGGTKIYQWHKKQRDTLEQ
jgi:hypothetical protein